MGDSAIVLIDRGGEIGPRRARQLAAPEGMPARAIVDQASTKTMTIMVSKHSPLSRANINKYIIRPQGDRFKQLFDAAIIRILQRMCTLIIVLRSNCPIRAFAAIPPVFQISKDKIRNRPDPVPNDMHIPLKSNIESAQITGSKQTLSSFRFSRDQGTIVIHSCVHLQIMPGHRAPGVPRPDLSQGIHQCYFSLTRL